MEETQWLVYCLLCSSAKSDRQLVYTGITKNWDARWDKHIAGEGAAFTRSYKPIKGAVVQVGLNKSEALKLEYKIKQLPRNEKLKLLENGTLAKCIG